MSTTAASKKKGYDPARQWGLKPDESASSGSTYVVSGHVISGSSADSNTMYIGENIGRDAQAKAARVSAKEADKALKALLEKDKEGMRAVLKAREAKDADKDDKGKGNDKKKKKKKAADMPEDPPLPPQKNAYSADVIKKLGFDPAARAGVRNESDVKKKVCTESSQIIRCLLVLHSSIL